MARTKNSNLHAAARAKKDEFYTQEEDIAREIFHYKDFFADKTVLCNCDDPYESNFFKYFAQNFNAFKLKKLIATCFKGSPVAGAEISLFEPIEHGFKIELDGIKNLKPDGTYDISDIREFLKTNQSAVQQLEGNGDFRSHECLELLRESDIVVTNPPFSLFREFVAHLVSFDKKFIIIGPFNAITYKEIFPLIKNDKMWLGYGFKNAVGFFYSPYEDIAVASDHREGLIRNSGVTWYTNVETEKRYRRLALFKRYYDEPENYPRYDNYDAIEVSRTEHIPRDYRGVMGVPITFLDKYNPQQFEILGLDRYTVPKEFLVGGRVAIDGKPRYARILIRRREEDFVENENRICDENDS